jgi:hypothetical protein
MIWITMIALGRLVIHWPDATPTTSLALLAPLLFPLHRAISMMITSLILSDLLLHFLLQYPIVGSWTFFTYSGWLAVVFLSYFFLKEELLAPAFTGELLKDLRGQFMLLFFSVISSLLFWLWTNLGTWCVTTLYPHTVSGLMTCYAAAIPFLKNSVVSAVVWSVILFGGIFGARINMRATEGSLL